MTTFRNGTKGNRGVSLAGGGYAWIAPGKTLTIPGHRVLGFPSDLTVTDPEPVGEPLPEQGDELPSLAGMTKAQLTERAGIEGVDVEAIAGTGQGGKVTNGDIVAAIEAKRTRTGQPDS